MYPFVLWCSVVQLVYNDEGLDAPENYTYPISLVMDGRVCLLFGIVLYLSPYASLLTYICGRILFEQHYSKPHLATTLLV